MSTAVILLVVVIAIVVGTALTLLTSAKKGMPTREVLNRARERSRDLENREKRERDR
jgi:hypothetical protein